MIAHYGKLIFLDLETTGPNPATDRITEIGIVEASADGVKRWSTLVNPRMPIPPFVSRLTGITDELVRDARDFAALHEELQQRLADGLFVAHNARFDYGFLRHEFRRLGKTFRCEVLCTLKLSRRLFPEHVSHGLDALVARHGLVTDARHRALGDAELLWQYWRLLERTVEGGKLRELVLHLLQRPQAPAHLDPDEFDDLPDAPGVYTFFDGEGRALFVGRAPQLRQRVLSRFHGDRPSPADLRLAGAAHRLEWQETAGDIGAQLLEARLLRQLQPASAAGRPPAQEICAWRIAVTPAGEVEPVLMHAGEPGFAHDAICYGLFTTREKAEAALRALALRHGLAGPSENGMPRIMLPASARPLLEKALSSLPMLNWPFKGPMVFPERSRNGREDLHVIDRWNWIGTVRSRAALPQLLAQAPAALSFEFDTYRILSRAMNSGKVAPEAAR